MKSLKKASSLLVVLIFLSFTLTGCYEDFINIYMEFTPGVYNRAKTEIASQEELEMDLRKIGQGKISELTESISFHEWGLNLAEVWPRKRKEYIRDIVRLHGNLNYRKAIIEEIGDDLEVKDIEKILDQMTDYQNSLDGVDKMNYEIFSEETKDLLRKVLEGKDENR